MDIVWNELAKGDNGMLPAVALQLHLPGAVLQLCYAMSSSPCLPPGFGLQGLTCRSAWGKSPSSVFIYLGIPFIAGFLTNMVLTPLQGQEWYTQEIHPQIAPHHPDRAALLPLW